MKKSEYKIVYTYSSRDDIRRMKKYILDTFKYREYANNFINKLKAATKELKILPTGFNTIEFQYVSICANRHLLSRNCGNHG